MRIFFIIPVSFFLLYFCPNTAAQAYIRINQSGYQPQESKIAIAFSEIRLSGGFMIIDEHTGKPVLSNTIQPATEPAWGSFPYYYLLDFSYLADTGLYRMYLLSTGDSSAAFAIHPDVQMNDPGLMLGFIRQQRCGYNPFLDIYCHQNDGRTMYGPMPDSTPVDVRGGWHDAGDQLKYLITSGNATARMLMAWEAAPEIFADSLDATGRPGANDIPDVLDEARWGLEWMHRMHPAPGLLFHQVADDRDHIGWKRPDRDSSDYGWGKGNARVVYFATGKPQGLYLYQSQATGIANLAGRAAAAMAIAYRIWYNDLDDREFANKCLDAAMDMYQMGKEKEGFQQGNSYGEPYRYSEDTWTDDMEWGALELFKATGKQKFLLEAIDYAGQSAAVSWMEHDTSDHYRYYPFVNVAHARLYEYAGPETKQQLAGYYKQNIDNIRRRAATNPFRIGVPFLWCSNNLVTAFVTQVLLYEQMTGDRQYHELMMAHLDWLFGRNPWGTSMFTGIPSRGEYPTDVHTSVWRLTQKEVPGGLVDGPVYATIYRNLRGLHLSAPDEFTDFQDGPAVYHDDIGDYSTNEPTMDGTADAIYMMSLYLSR
jgi:hypothetical protein